VGTSQGPGDPDRIGPYRVVRLLGAGGMGRVYLGRSAGGRLVAVKVIRAELAADPEFRTRFRREVAAAQQVNGLYTALVVQADVDGPVPWLATAYVPGPTLAAAVSEHGPLPAASVLGLAAGLTESLAAIHAVGLVHRDLKPSNVLLADDGPRVIDFGIVRAAEGTSVLTSIGMKMGSPGFMSPEEAEGQPVGPPSDMFSLGALLVFAATGRGPFGTGSTAALVYRVVYAPPDLTGVPAEVQSLVGRLLAKDPGQRPTAAALLTELSSTDGSAGWLPAKIAEASGAPAQPPVQPSVQAPAWQPGAGAPGAPGAAGAPPTQTNVPADTRPPRLDEVPWWKDSPIVREQLGLRARPAGGPLRWLGSRIGPGQPRAIAAGAGAAVVALIVALLVVLPSGSGGSDTLKAALADPGSKYVYGVTFSPDGKLVAAADGNGSSYLWNVATGKITATLKDPDSSGVSVDAFSPDGSALSAADGNGSAYQWSTSTWKLASTFTDPSSKGMIASSFSPGGGLLATADLNGTAYLWNLSTGKMAGGYADQSSTGVNFVAFSPDGTLLAAADQDGSSYLWNVASGQVSEIIPDPNSKGVISVQFSPDGKLLLAGDGNGSSYLWNVSTGRLVFAWADPHSKGVDDAAFSPNGDLVATADRNGHAYLWDVSTGQFLATLTDPRSKGLFDASFGPDGSVLAVADGNGHVYLWSVHS
jgi:hypothetical protein